MIATLIVFAIAAGGYMGYLRLRTTDSQPAPNTPLITHVQTPVSSSTSLRVPPNTQNQVQAVIDIPVAYDVLFKQLGAVKVSFVEANSSAAHAELTELYEADKAIAIQLFPDVPFSMEISFVDLTYDGIPEAIVYENTPALCGTGGCRLSVYKKEQEKWVSVLGTLAVNDIVAYATTLRYPYADLFLSLYGPTGSETAIVRYAWNGHAYRPEKAVAVWDGSAFQLIK